MSQVKTAELTTPSPAAGVMPDWQEIERTVACGRRLQARAVAGLLQFVARGVAAVAAWLGRGRRRRADGYALLQMNDRALADIGLSRVDVQGFAYGVIPAAQLASAEETRPTGAKVRQLRLVASHAKATDVTDLDEAA